PIIVEVTFRNPLKVPLLLSNLSLLWRFTIGTLSGGKESTSEQLGGETITNEDTSSGKKDEIVTTEIIQEFYLGSEETKTVSCCLMKLTLLASLGLILCYTINL
ncbi:hypothetical protein XENORESO_017949, partial [Xenotaenia resolanae]